MRNWMMVFALTFAVSAWAQTEWEAPMSAQEKLELAKQAEAAAKKARIEAEKEAKKAAKEEAKAAKQAQKKAALEARQAAKSNAAKDNPAPQDVTVAPKTAKENSSWARPEKKVEVKEKPVAKHVEAPVELKEDPKYLRGAVPEEDGKVVFTLDLNVPGKDAAQIYDQVYEYLDKLTLEENQLKGSQVSLINKKEHIIAASIKEWLVFSSSFISLDRTEFDYTVIARCEDRHLLLTISRIYYVYDEGGKEPMKAHAEEMITDRAAVNKKGNDLVRMYKKFRKKTIDRKDEIFAQITSTLINH